MRSQDILIVVILIFLLVPSVKNTIAHMKGEGSCCGGPKEKSIKKKISGKPMSKLIVHIEGMQCDNCRNRVERNLNELDGVVSQVKLSKKQAIIQLYKEVDEASIRDTIERLGFEVVEIEKGCK